MRDYDYDIYAEEMDYREKEWDEPGPEFGHIIRTNRVTGEFDIFNPDGEECRLCGGGHDWHDCDVVADLKNLLKGKR